MYDNKIRLSPDVLEKAERIAATWGLKNTRAAVEAVFRRYCDDYLYGRHSGASLTATVHESPAPWPPIAPPPSPAFSSGTAKRGTASEAQCEALDALDELLAL